MMTPVPAPARPLFISWATAAAIAAATLSGYLQSHFDGRGTIGLALLCVLACVISSAGGYWAERRGGRRAVDAVLAVYGAIIAAALFVSQGRAMLIAMPLVSMLVLYHSWRAALVGGLLIEVMLALVAAHFAFPSDAVAAGLVGTASAFAFVIVFSQLARSERYARAEVERLSAEVEQLATTKERNRIAREIHDSLGHCLTVASVQLEAARSSPDGRDERLERVQGLLREGLVELRTSVSMLRDPSPRQPFADALAELVSECGETGLQATLATTGLARPLSSATGFTLYRAAQEALTNVQRHARARRVTVALAYEPLRVTLAVSDDGVGLSGTPDGNGLTGLRERVALVGGAVQIESVPGAGVQVRVEVPA